MPKCNYEELCIDLGINPIPECSQDDDCPLGLSNPCMECDSYSSKVFPEFTPYKQVKVEELLMNKGNLTKYRMKTDSKEYACLFNGSLVAYGETYTEALSDLLKRLIHSGDLEKETIKEILQ